jgi:hypothetical protein
VLESDLQLDALDPTLIGYHRRNGSALPFDDSGEVSLVRGYCGGQVQLGNHEHFAQEWYISEPLSATHSPVLGFPIERIIVVLSSLYSRHGELPREHIMRRNNSVTAIRHLVIGKSQSSSPQGAMGLSPRLLLGMSIMVCTVSNMRMNPNISLPRLTLRRMEVPVDFSIASSKETHLEIWVVTYYRSMGPLKGSPHPELQGTPPAHYVTP